MAALGSTALAMSLFVAPGASAEGSASASLDAESSADANAESDDRPMRKWAPERNMWELGLYMGVYIPSSRHEFYDPRVVAHSPYQRAAFDIGTRFAYFPLRWLGLEMELGFIPTRTRVTDQSALLYTVRGHGIFQLPWWRLTPFLLVGGGGMGVASSDASQSDDIDANFHWGPGLKFFCNKWIAVRMDFRHLVGARRAIEAGASNHFEVLFGVSVTLGRKKDHDDGDDDDGDETSGDPDGDGYYGEDDKCPDEAGTYPDGCPEKDTDGDGVGDDTDKCVDEPGPAPDGCPATSDKDEDGIADSSDKCPDEKGAKPDGCPPDSDGDGVPDDEDKCIDLAGNQPDGCPPDSDGDKVYDPEDECKTKKETRNGFEDDDGCPDKVPRRLRGAVGVLPGITFESNSAKITRESRPTLDEAAETLKGNPSYRLEVVGHTDSTGPRQHNIELSQRRADSVKAYLVRKGIEADRIKTKGKGPDDPVADNETAKGRAQNRRIEFKVRKGRRDQ
jgi:outer membrane protein OmpA-like peptidoglycan-associated protein